MPFLPPNQQRQSTEGNTETVRHGKILINTYRVKLKIDGKLVGECLQAQMDRNTMAH